MNIFAVATLDFAVQNTLSGALASPDEQFAGCADEADLATGLVFIAREINGVTLTVSAVGINGFDPQITAIDPEDGSVLTCNDNASSVEELAFNLPTATASASALSSEVQVTVAADERRDVEFVVTGNRIARQHLAPNRGQSRLDRVL